MKHAYSFKRALLLLTIVVVLAGFMRGWFAVSGPNRQAATNKVNVDLTVDPEKIKEDARYVEKQAEGLTDKAREEFRKQ